MSAFPNLRFRKEVWKLNRPYLMGAINLNQDSFFPDSRILNDEVFFAKLEEMTPYLDILDLGAESTRPGADPISPEEEWDRILPKLRYAKQKYPGLKISIDTYKAEVARKCIAGGADLINDVSAGEFSQGEMFSVCAESDVPLILMHKRGVPKTMQDQVFYQNVVREVYNYLQNRVTLAQEYGLGFDQILIDVGIGFGKRLQHNLDLIRCLPKFKEIGVGIMIGASRKSMLGEITGQTVNDRLAGSIAVHLAALCRSCAIVRCHDVREMRDALDVFFAIIDYDSESSDLPELPKVDRLWG